MGDFKPEPEAQKRPRLDDQPSVINEQKANDAEEQKEPTRVSDIWNMND